MRFLPVIDLWNPGIHEAVFNGQLKLQCGQWVRCGSNQLSRFVRFTGGSIWAAHPEGERGTSRSFPRLCAAAGKGATKRCSARDQQ